MSKFYYILYHMKKILLCIILAMIIVIWPTLLSRTHAFSDTAQLPDTSQELESLLLETMQTSDAHWYQLYLRPYCDVDSIDWFLVCGEYQKLANLLDSLLEQMDLFPSTKYQFDFNDICEFYFQSAQ